MTRYDCCLPKIPGNHLAEFSYKSYRVPVFIQGGGYANKDRVHLGSLEKSVVAENTPVFETGLILPDEMCLM